MIKSGAIHSSKLFIFKFILSLPFLFGYLSFQTMLDLRIEVVFSNA